MLAERDGKERYPGAPVLVSHRYRPRADISRRDGSNFVADRRFQRSTRFSRPVAFLTELNLRQFSWRRVAKGIKGAVCAISERRDGCRVDESWTN